MTTENITLELDDEGVADLEAAIAPRVFHGPYRVLAPELVLPAGPNVHAGDLIDWPSEDLSGIARYIDEGWMEEVEETAAVDEDEPSADEPDAAAVPTA